MLKYKYLPETEIKNTITYANNTYHSIEIKYSYLKKQLSLSDDQIKFALDYYGNKLKYRLFEMAGIEDEIQFSKIYMAKYDTYLHFKPYKYFAFFLMALLTFIPIFSLVVSIIEKEDNTAIIIVFALFAIIFDSFNVLIGLLLKRSFYGIKDKLLSDKIIDVEGVISRIRVKSYIGGPGNFLSSLLSPNISFLIIGVDTSNAYYNINVPIKPIQIKGSLHSYDLKLLNEFVDKKIKIRFYEKSRLLKDSNINIESICNKLNR